MATKRKLLFSLILLVEALVIAFTLMQRFPPSNDDYSYLYQAKIFASGKIYASRRVAWQTITDVGFQSIRRAGLFSLHLVRGSESRGSLIRYLVPSLYFSFCDMWSSR